MPPIAIGTLALPQVEAGSESVTDRSAIARVGMFVTVKTLAKLELISFKASGAGTAASTIALINWTSYCNVRPAF